MYSFLLKGGMGDLGGVRDTGPGALWYPAGIGSDQGQTPGAPRRIYVADTQNNYIQIFNADGSFYAQFGGAGDGDGQFLSPTGVAVDAQGWILVADNENHRIQLFKPEGPDAQNPTSFVFKKKFGTYGDYDAGPDGTPINRDPATRPIAPLDEFNYPNRVAIRPGTLLGEDASGNSLDDGNGRVAVLDQVNNRVVVLNARLEPLFAFGEYGTDAVGEFEYPYGVGMDAQRIYVADPENHRIQIFNIDWAANTATPAASFGSETAANSAGDLEKPHDVQSDGTRLFVNDTFRNRVLVLNPDPDPLSAHTPRCKQEQASANAGRCSIQATDGSWYDARVVGGPGDGSGDHLDGRFGLAEALTIDPTGRLVVADTNFHRFQVFKPSRLAVSSVTLSPQPGQTVISGATVGVTVRIANSGQTPLSVSPTLMPSTSGETPVLNSPAPAQILPGDAVDFDYSYTTGNTGNLSFTAGASAPAGVGAGTLQVTAPPLTAGTITVDPKPEAAMGIQVSLLSSVVGVGQPVTVKVTVSNPGGFDLQNVTPTVTPDGSDPQGFVTNPANPAPLGSLAKGAPAHTFTFTFTAAKLGQVTFTASASATYTEGTVTSPISATTSTGVTLTIADDVDPPVTVLSVPVPNGLNGWYISSPVLVTLRATDNVALQSLNYTLGGAGGGTFNVPAQGTSFEKIVPLTREGATDFTYWAADLVPLTGVEAQRTVTILIDPVKPGINSAGISPLPNAAGWNNTFPTVRFVAQDGESGIASVTGVDPLTLVNNGVYVGDDGTGIPIGGTAVDVAGNTRSIIVPVNVDTKAPTVTCTTTPASANSFGWFTAAGPVTVSCTGTDQPLLSGMASVTVDCPRPTGPSSVGVGVVTASCALDAEGDHTVMVNAKDVAGNLTPTQVRVRIDRTPPTVTCGTDSGGNTWPPNHKWVPWTTLVEVKNAGISGSAGFELFWFSSSEDANGKGDGNTSVDMDMKDWIVNTSDTSGSVRAERTGPRTGRIYRLFYKGADGAGNTTTCVSTLAVPHDQGKQ